MIERKVNMKHSYKPQGVCSQKITFALTDGVLSDVRVEGGCNGNLKGICALLEGMKAQDVVDRFSGIRCGFKKTSCPDQIAQAIKKAQNG